MTAPVEQLPSLATWDQVVDAYEGDLDESTQRTWVESKIARASRMLRSKVRDIDARIEAGTLDPGAASDVIVEAVLRIIRNPEGLQMEMEGNYSYQARADVAGGSLRFLPDELAMLRPPSNWRPGPRYSRVPGWRQIP